MELFGEDQKVYGVELGDGVRCVECLPWLDGGGVDLRFQRSSTEFLSLNSEELLALSLAIDAAITAGALKPGHVPPGVWSRLKAWFVGRRKKR